LVAGQSGILGSGADQLKYPTTIILDQFENLYIMDAGNNRIQRWAPQASVGVTIIAGSLANPRGIAFDRSGNLVIADSGYNRIVSAAVSCGRFNIRFMSVHGVFSRLATLI